MEPILVSSDTASDDFGDPPVSTKKHRAAKKPSKPEPKRQPSALQSPPSLSPPHHLIHSPPSMHSIAPRWHPLASRDYSLKWELQKVHDDAVWCMALYSLPDKNRNILALTSKAVARLYDLQGKTPNLVQTIKCAGDDLMALCWLASADAGLMLSTAGTKGIVHIVSVTKGTSTAELLGHGDAITALASHPKMNHVLASASRDYSVRLWDATAGTCVAVFGGHRAHVQPVLCIDFCADGSHLVSGGMDELIAIWDVDEALELQAKNPMRPVVKQMPLYGTRRLHESYIDGLRFLDHAVLSRSADHCMILWDAIPRSWHRTDGSGRLLRTFDVGNGETIWWVKFNVGANVLACGTTEGVLRLWDLDAPPRQAPSIAEKPQVILEPPPSCQGAAIRSVVIEPNGRFIICSNDAGNVWMYEEAETP